MCRRAVVVRQEGVEARAVVTNLDAPPGLAGAKFEEFSAPLVTSDGSVLVRSALVGEGRGQRVVPVEPLAASRRSRCRRD
jgi:hypothetical protein